MREKGNCSKKRESMNIQLVRARYLYMLLLFRTEVLNFRYLRRKLPMIQVKRHDKGVCYIYPADNIEQFYLNLEKCKEENLDLKGLQNASL